MKKIFSLIIFAVLSICNLLPVYSFDIYKDYRENKHVYEQYLKDIEYVVKTNVNSEEIKTVLENLPPWEQDIEICYTIDYRGRIQKITRHGSRKNPLFKLLNEPVEKYGFNPFYKGMNISYVKVWVELHGTGGSSGSSGRDYYISISFISNIEDYKSKTDKVVYLTTSTLRDIVISPVMLPMVILLICAGL